MIELSGHLTSHLAGLLALAADPAPAGLIGGGAIAAIPEPAIGPWWIALIPALPLLASILCLTMMFLKVRSKIPAWTTVVLLGISFVLTLMGFLAWQGGDQHPQVVTAWSWIATSWGSAPGQTLSVDIGFYMDGLSWLWMLFVTGLATLIGLYASEYMSGDPGYPRFFAGFALFVTSMSCLVMGDNIVLLYLGWEGVGLCSYLLIGYYYTKPSAVEAAKKAFIVNRIGDLGLALGLFLIFTTFGTVRFDELFQLVPQGVNAAGEVVTGRWTDWAIPCLLMLGAFGKSAQFPLYVWLPDAMEGPTPVSALIHAATMVTAGVYLIARMFPIFGALDEHHVALTTVAIIGTVSALLAATIGMAQFDIKRIMAYSTVSQLGYMFAGLGFLTTTGAAFHVLTHAFFKATLFLCCGAVMHGFAGQLDLRKISGLWRQPGWLVVSIAMLIGCLNLAGFPFTAGYFSKDMILAEAFVTPGMAPLGWILLITAGLTAYYTFRVFFRVFVGPVHYEPGDEAHDHAAHDDDHHDHHHPAGETHAHDPGQHGDHHADHFHPHPPGWAINSVLAILAICSVLAAGLYFINKDNHGWVGGMLHESTAYFHSPHGAHDAHSAADAAHAGEAASHASSALFGLDPHKAMYYISGLVCLIGIAVAFVLHYAGRTEAATARADKLLPYLGPIPRWAENKWYVDEFYDFIIRKPLWVIGNIFHLFDKLIVDGLVNGAGLLPRVIAQSIRPSQSGILQSYAVGMACGIGILLLLAFLLI